MPKRPDSPCNPTGKSSAPGGLKLLKDSGSFSFFDCGLELKGSMRRLILILLIFILTSCTGSKSSTNHADAEGCAGLVNFRVRGTFKDRKPDGCYPINFQVVT